MVTDRPRITEGHTVVVRTGMGKIYITVNEVGGKPFEVFVTAGKSGKSVQAKAEAIGRLVSLNLRSGTDVLDIIKQLGGIAGDKTMNDTHLGLVLSIPDAIAKILKELYVEVP